MQKFAEEALQQLPEIMRELRRRSESFKLEEIEEAMTKLNISPTQSLSLIHIFGEDRLRERGSLPATVFFYCRVNKFMFVKVIVKEL